MGQKTGRKFALLIGVSEFGEGFKPLHTPNNAVAQLREILTDPAIGGFPAEQVTELLNPTVGEMQASISDFFGSCRSNDVALLYFVGHGVKNETADFYFSTRQTRKLANGSLNAGTAVAASFVLGEMGRSLSKRQVVILDCCFSGAFPDGVMAMDDDRVDVEQQLGGKGRAVLTAATSMQYALEQENEELSVYSRYLLEGLKTGAAAPDDQQWIEAGHLHDYVRQKLETAAASMSPQIYAAREGRSIVIAKAPVGDPVLRYRKLVQSVLRDTGKISAVGRRRLKLKGKDWGLEPDQMKSIEAEVCRPFLERQANLAEYEEAYGEALEEENPLSELTRKELADYQRDLKLSDDDVGTIYAKFPALMEMVVDELLPEAESGGTGDEGEGLGSGEQSFVEDLGNGVSFEMIHIPRGTFMMGSPEGKGEERERPQHKVTVPSFYMGKYVVTQAVYEELISENPSKFKGKNRPVERVSWNEAIAFCQKLSDRTGKTYRLPSEAEWEYACRAGMTTEYYFGDEITTEQANYGKNVGKTSDVGSYPANGFGLYDMHGNVWEWCADYWHEGYKKAPTDGSAWIQYGNDKYRIIRGGSWVLDPPGCRAACRDWLDPGSRVYSLGFRLVCSAP